MIYILVPLIVVLMAMVVISLFRGLNAFRQSMDDGAGEEGVHELQLMQNRMMWARIKYQLAAIVVVALLLMIATTVFYERHWDAVTRRLALGVAGDVALIVDNFDEMLRQSKEQPLVIHGGVPGNKRQEYVDEFQNKPSGEFDAMILSPKAGGVGLTLTAANTIIWYAPVTSVETYLQANARVHRAGQRNPCTVVHLQGSPVEKKMYKMLEGKVDIHNRMIDLYKNIIEDDS